MNLRFFHGMTDDNYGWELDLFRKNRNLKDGFTAVEFNINFDRYVGDHNPKFELSLILFNFLIFEFTIYNVWHIEHEQSPFYGLNHSGEKLSAIYHNRSKFYHGKEIYWYQLLCDGDPLSIDEVNTYDVPPGFLRLPDTKYFEYGGSHEDAIKELKSNGFCDIVEGEPLWTS